MRQLAAASAAESLTLHIASPGGSVYDGYQIYHAIIDWATRDGKKKPVYGVIAGEAQSMATFISAAVDKGQLEIADPSRYMIHNPSQKSGGDKTVLRKDADELERIENEMAEVYASRTKIPVDQIKDMMKKETQMTAQDAVRMGFADKISERLKAVAIGKSMKPVRKETFLSKILGPLFRNVEAQGATALDIPLQDGKTMVSDAVDEAGLVGSAVSIDGAVVPDGDYVTASGATVSVVAGKITNVVAAETSDSIDKQIADLQAKKTKLSNPAPVPAPQPLPPATSEADKKLAEAEKQLAALKAEKDKADADKVKAEQEQNKVVLALAEKEKELEEQKKKTVGNSSNPNKQFQRVGAPVGFGGIEYPKESLMASRSFLADFMPWMEKFYEGGKYSDGTPFTSYRTGGPNAVSILETSFNYTWNGILTTDLFYKPTLDSPALSDVMTIDPGTKDKKQYNLVGTLSKVLQPYFGCTTTPNTNRALITNKTIQVKEFRMYEGWCKDDFTGQLSGSYNFLAQEWLKTGEASFDPAGTPIDRIIMTLLKDALRRDVQRRVWFADSTTADTDYNQFDGFWQSLIDQSGASNYCVLRSGAALGIATLAANTASTYFGAMYNNSALLLKQEYIDKGSAQFLVTRSVWENYYDTIVAVGSVSEQEYLNYLQGIKRLTFRGIPVIPITLWDSFLQESDNPLTSVTRHLIALTPKENHILGVEDVGDLSKIDSWYEMKDSKRYYRADMKMGFLGPLHCELTTIAY